MSNVVDSALMPVKFDNHNVFMHPSFIIIVRPQKEKRCLQRGVASNLKRDFGAETHRVKNIWTHKCERKKSRSGATR